MADTIDVENTDNLQALLGAMNTCLMALISLQTHESPEQKLRLRILLDVGGRQGYPGLSPNAVKHYRRAVQSFMAGLDD